MGSIRDHLISGMTYDEDDERKRKKSVGKGYFADCVLVAIPKKNGKGVKYERIYVGSYYVKELSPAKAFALKLLYCVLFVSAACLLVLGGLNAPSDDAYKYASIPYIASIVCMLWLLMSLATYISLPCKINAFHYQKASVDSIRSSLISSICAFLAAFVSVCFCFVDGSDILSSVVMTGEYLLAAGCLMAIAITEKKVSYKKIKPVAAPLDGLPEGAYILE